MFNQVSVIEVGDCDVIASRLEPAVEPAQHLLNVCLVGEWLKDDPRLIALDPVRANHIEYLERCSHLFFGTHHAVYHHTMVGRGLLHDLTGNASPTLHFLPLCQRLWGYSEVGSGRRVKLDLLQIDRFRVAIEHLLSDNLLIRTFFARFLPDMRQVLVFRFDTWFRAIKNG